jgi:hypothetical protein
MTPWFIATEPFTPDSGESWNKYVAWSGLTQLDEVVSLDGILCPTVLPEIHEDYWPHIVQEDFMPHFFLDFDFLVRKVAAIPKKNVLCVFRNPERHPIAPPVASFEFPAATFEFLGYDLVDVAGDVSALTNCGGFPDVFANSDLSCYGLLPEFGRAAEVQKLLRARHPEERHANCHLWAIFRAAAL